MTRLPKVIFLVETSRAYGRGLLKGIARYARLHGPWLFSIMGPEFYLKGIEHSYQWIKDQGADGIFAPLWNTDIVDMIVDLGLPAMICGVERPSLNVCRIVTDDDAVGRTAAEYFLERGFQQFAYCGSDSVWSRLRAESFRRTVDRAGFEIQCYAHVDEPPSAGNQDEPMRIAEWLKSLPNPSAVMACNDDRARDVLAACRIADLDVPGQVSILGVDNDELICDLSYPQLSSIAAGTEPAGYEAAHVLDKLMSGQTITDTDKEVMVSPLHVVTRQSTDVMAITDTKIAEAVHYIRHHDKDVIQVGDVAEAIGLSRRTLEKRFRTVLSRSVHDEITYARVNRMADLLTSTHLSVTQITRMLGYPYPNNISRCFKRQKGLSPSVYRKRYGAK